LSAKTTASLLIFVVRFDRGEMVAKLAGRPSKSMNSSVPQHWRRKMAPICVFLGSRRFSKASLALKTTPFHRVLPRPGILAKNAVSLPHSRSLKMNNAVALIKRHPVPSTIVGVVGVLFVFTHMFTLLVLGAVGVGAYALVKKMRIRF